MYVHFPLFWYFFQVEIDLVPKCVHGLFRIKAGCGLAKKQPLPELCVLTGIVLYSRGTAATGDIGLFAKNRF